LLTAPIREEGEGHARSGKGSGSGHKSAAERFGKKPAFTLGQATPLAVTVRSVIDRGGCSHADERS